LGGGFTSEQLIAYFGSFDNLLNAFSIKSPIYIDFSSKYKGKESPLIVTYPFCGLENLSKNFSEKNFENASNYSLKIKEEPQTFLDESITKFNEYFWDKRVQKLKNQEEYSGPDIFLYKKENKLIRKIIDQYKPIQILDLGCGNGFSTKEICSGLESKIFGIDRTKEAIENAKQMNFKDDNFEFIVSNMDNLPFKDENFDFAYAKRSICNLPSFEKQKEAINEAARVLKKGGILCISDLILEGYNKLTNWREKLNLSALRHPNHVKIPSEKEILEISQDKFQLINSLDYTSSYYFMTRILYPLFSRFSNKNLRFDSSFHKFSSKLPSLGSIGANKLYILKKK